MLTKIYKIEAKGKSLPMKTIQPQEMRNSLWFSFITFKQIYKYTTAMNNPL